MRIDRSSLKEFFREGIERAQRNQKLGLQEQTQFYLVNLLAEFLEIERLYPLAGPPGAETPTDEPLALLYARALETVDPNSRFRLLKDLGDRSLYVSGFFGDSLRRRLVDIDYYIAMGGHAYASVSSIAKARPQGDLFSDLFGELSKKFSPVVEVVAELSESSGLTSDTDLLRLYERWLATRSERLRGMLCEKGLLPVDGSKEPVH